MLIFITTMWYIGCRDLDDEALFGLAILTCIEFLIELLILCQLK
jgi:hypothetical protein